jgi:hypothetical protein
MISAKENVSRLYHHEMPEFLPIMGQGIINNVPVSGIAERPQTGKSGYDWFGVHWEWKAGEPAPMPGPEFILEDIADWREVVKFPDLDAWDWEKAAQTDRIPQFDYENNLLYQMIHNGIFERLHEFMGFEGALCCLLTDPDEVKAYAEAMADYKCRLIDKLAEHYKPDIICYHDDWGTQKGLFFSPEVWRDIFKAPTKRIVNHCQSKGILFELHSDGDVSSLIPEIVDDLGVDGLNVMKIVDVPAMKKITGNKVVYNVFLDTQTLDVLDALGQLTEEKFREVIRAEMTTLAEGGCYIPAMILVRPEWVPWITAEYEKCKAALQVQRNSLSR